LFHKASEDLNMLMDNFTCVAQTFFEEISLRQDLGCYLLDLGVGFVPTLTKEKVWCLADLHCSLRVSGDGGATGGSAGHVVARPVGQTFIRPAVSDLPQQARQLIRFRFVLTRDAIDEIEKIRHHDLWVHAAVHATVFAVPGEGTRGQGTGLGEQRRPSPPGGLHTQSDNVTHKVPESEWIQKLNEAGYSRTLLFEIPLLTADGGKRFAPVEDALHAARKSFHEARYTQAVGECRKALEAMCAATGTAKLPWKDVLGQAKQEMPIRDRFSLSLTTTWHLTDPAHHDGEYDREQAHYILGMTGIAVSLYMRKPGLAKPTAPTA